MYVCVVITYSRVWINQVRMPILLVVSSTEKMNIPVSPCVPENLVSRDGFSRPVPPQPAHLHTQAEFGPYLRDSSRVPRRRPVMKLQCPAQTDARSVDTSGQVRILYLTRCIIRQCRQRDPERTRGSTAAPVQRYFQHAHFIPIAGVGKRGTY